MHKMRALLLRQGGVSDASGAAGGQFDDPETYLELGTISVPEPGPGQILIQVRRAAINPSDIAFVRGLYGQPRQRGTPPGFEGVGKVIAAGPGLMGKILKGRDVAFYATPDGTGSWAEYAVTQASAALPLKKGITDSDAASMVINPVTAAAMLDMVRPGQAFVFSAAASQLGKLTASLARDQGKKMIAIIRRDSPAETLRQLGAASVLNETAHDFDQQLAQVMQDLSPRVFLDAVAGGTSPAIFKAMGQNATWVVYGKLDDTACEIIEPGELIFLNKKVQGFWAAEWSAQTPFLRKLKIFNEVQKRFRDGRWHTDVNAELPLDQTLHAMGQALTRADGKVQIVMSGK